MFRTAPDKADREWIRNALFVAELAYLSEIGLKSTTLQDLRGVAYQLAHSFSEIKA